MLQRVPLDLDNALALGNGELNVLLKQHLKRLAQDVIDRPGDPAKRSVTLKFEFVPKVGSKANGDKCNLVVECTSKIPVYRTPEYDMLVTHGGFMFSPESPDEVDQRTLYESESEG